MNVLLSCKNHTPQFFCSGHTVRYSQGLGENTHSKCLNEEVSCSVFFMGDICLCLVKVMCPVNHSVGDYESKRGPITLNTVDSVCGGS